MNKGKLFMLPVPIADGGLNDTLPEHTIQTARELKFFLGENAKSARAFLKFCGHPSPIASLSIEEIGHRPDSAKVRGWLKPALEGNDIGIVSEAGCPGVADPGAQIAAEAHKLGIRVVPLVGPSSILLALMASGMDGQHFRFCGYLPIKEPARTNAIKDLERKSASSEGETQLFIETPYRNSGMLADLVKTARLRRLFSRPQTSPGRKSAFARSPQRIGKNRICRCRSSRRSLEFSALSELVELSFERFHGPDNGVGLISL